jgi:uncharacterized membrane protein YfcA
VSDLTALEAGAVFLAGVGAGTVNGIVGSGSLLTFPTLLAVGYPAVVANVSNNIGVLPGSVSSAWGYRRELRGQGPRLARLGCASLSGGLTGALLLLALPGSSFRRIVPVLILLACALVVAQPRLRARVAARRAGDEPAHGGGVLFGLVFLTGVYGGYFGAAQGVLLMALLGTFLADELVVLNGVKNVLAMIANGVAGIVFLVLADPAWEAVAIVGAGAAIGGVLGATVGRRLAPERLRVLIVVVGLVAAGRLLLRG